MTCKICSILSSFKFAGPISSFNSTYLFGVNNEYTLSKKRIPMLMEWLSLKEKTWFKFVYQTAFIEFQFIILVVSIKYKQYEHLNQMRSEIAKSFYEKQNDLPLRRAIVEKKSRWLKSWRMYLFNLSSRHIALFSNKLIFTTNENSKPKDSNVVFLGDIH